MKGEGKIQFDSHGVPCHGITGEYYPAIVARYALAHWSLYLVNGAEHHRKAFLAQAYWLLENELGIGDDAGGWPVFSTHSTIPSTGPWLSALVQGCGISVLLRAFQLTQEEAFIKAAQRVVLTFERDILDGGICAPVGNDGVFFEQIAVYPATHILAGCIFALFGLYNYVEITHDIQIEKLIQRSLITMHGLLDEFDTGFWTYSNLLDRHLASPSQLAEQSMLLAGLARYSQCDHCSALASRWKAYLHSSSCCLRFRFAQCRDSMSNALWRPIQSLLFQRNSSSHTRTPNGLLRVCAPITAFPVTGGMRTVLTSVDQVTRDIWHMEYLTQHVGPNPEHLIIHRFGTTKTAPWQFPAVWLYVLAGGRKLISLLRRSADYQLILPQDGTFTAAFAALVAKLANIRVVCMDYGNMTLVRSLDYRSERVKVLARKGWLQRLLGRLQFACYWSSLYVFAWIAAHLVDHFLVAGIAGDGVEDVYCQQLGVHAGSITRYPYMIDVERHVVLDAGSRATLRAKHGIAADAIVITMICRFAPEKGIDIALESIREALAVLSPDASARVQVIIAGDGPLRRQIEEDILKWKLSEVCLLWGEASREDVISLLSISDIFLHTSTRGAYYTMSILEAMASGCAVVASTQPSLNVQLLADNRGLVVPTGDVVQTGRAIAQLVNNPELRGQMGKGARDYIVVEHSPMKLRRVLMRATYWSALDAFLGDGKGSER